MINTSHVQLPDDFDGAPHYSDICYVYALTDGLTPFYVGSSNRPLSRYYIHLAEKTEDNKAKIAELKAEGKQITMFILDITIEAHRHTLEGYWINHLLSKGHPILNTDKYPLHNARFIAKPHNFYSLSHGNLAQYVLGERIKPKKDN